MKATELLRYILKTELEWRWENDDVIVWVPFYELQDFYNIVKGSGGVFDDGGVECTMVNGYIAFEMKCFCDYYGVEMEEVFPKMEGVV